MTILIKYKMYTRVILFFEDTNFFVPKPVFCLHIGVDKTFVLIFEKFQLPPQFLPGFSGTHGTFGANG